MSKESREFREIVEEMCEEPINIIYIFLALHMQIKQDNA
jgi:uncharacterized protein YfbU (UPF0304 family)